jgi:hypothetical protein
MIDPNPMLDSLEDSKWWSARLPNGDVIKVEDSHFSNFILKEESAFRREHPGCSQDDIDTHLDQTVYRANYWINRKKGDRLVCLLRKERKIA